MDFYHSETFTLVILPILIFLSRVCDVTIGTVRVISVSRGHKFLAPMFGFFEVLIWIIVIGKVMENLNNPLCYIAYAGGFAVGNFVGICVEEKLAMGSFIIRVITQKNAAELTEKLVAEGFGVTAVKAEGAEGSVDVIYSIINRSDLKHVLELIREFNPNAFYTIEDVRYVKQGILRKKKPFFGKNLADLPKLYRKGK
ncbi:MAG: DUF2179 domain-containing protein [Sedimentisphaerales bacterium]|nr:DUF2179 domain-containing protein [Sedimentisphaerales bacterium]